MFKGHIRVYAISSLNDDINPFRVKLKGRKESQPHPFYRNLIKALWSL